ncbi:MAG TPA: carboxypeptidase regulatory-like domain-containing protein [Blastocatellia bacterium]|nr:carboxypeptidase regulatory-like domain-containing protein [Blastocatellia bacterium]
MKKTIKLMTATLALLLGAVWQVNAQSTAGAISGVVTDQQGAVVANAAVTARNVGTNESRSATTDGDGRYRFPNLSVGSYEITVQARGFAKYVRTGVELLLNQDAVVNAPLKTSTVEEVVTINENASLLNTSNAEVSTRFDSKRLSELPLAPNRNVLNVALSAAGVSQLGSGQTGFAQGLNFSVNGMRLRSNNFMLDGQDSNDPSVSGSQQPINNPDVVQEFRLVTNQFAPEFGRAAGSVVNIVSKSGSNNLHGSAFFFNNNEVFNARSNLDKAAGFKDAPRRNEAQFGGTLGGPIIKDKTFFFGSYQRWTDRQLGSGATIAGVPTEAGRQILQTQAGSRPQVAALLKFLPAATAGNNTSANFTLNNQTFTVPLGSLTSANSIAFNNHQWSSRVDHRFSEKHQINGRFFFNDENSVGTGQATPRGLANLVTTRNQSANVGFTSILSTSLVNEARIAYQRFGSVTNAQDPSSETIPSIEINQLGLIGFNAAGTRTAIGLAVNLPQFRFNNTYQIIDNLSWTKGSHAMKFGLDFRRVQVKSFFFPTIRGRVAYDTLNNFVNDVAIASAINKPVPGGSEIQYYNWYDYFFYAQDEWRVRPNLSLTYGLRYETPGNSIGSLQPFNDKILAANGNNPVFRFRNPGRDTNNLQPRFGFNWRPNFGDSGVAGMLFGGDKTVIRGGIGQFYAPVWDDPGNLGFSQVTNLVTGTRVGLPDVSITDPFPTGLIAASRERTNTIGQGFSVFNPQRRIPNVWQYSVEIQRQLPWDMLFSIAGVGSSTRQIQVSQSINEVPESELAKGSAYLTAQVPNPFAGLAPGTGLNGATVQRQQLLRPFPQFTGITVGGYAGGKSQYFGLQSSIQKRFTAGATFTVSHTWAKQIDRINFQNPQDTVLEKQIADGDVTHNVGINGSYELPFGRGRKLLTYDNKIVNGIVGGWTLNGLVRLQSGMPTNFPANAEPVGGIDPIPSNQTIDQWYTQGSFRTLAAFTLRRFSLRYGNLRNPPIRNFDLSAFKTFGITESIKLQFRAELINAMNTPQWFNGPVTNPASGNFGRIGQGATSQSNLPRFVQLALKLTF